MSYYPLDTIPLSPTNVGVDPQYYAVPAMSTNQHAMLLAARPEPGLKPRPGPRPGPRIGSNGYCSFGYYHGNPLANTHEPAHGAIGTPAPVPEQHLVPKCNSSPSTDMTQSATHPYSSSDISDAVQHILDQYRGCVVSDAELIRLVQKRLIIRHGSLVGNGVLTDYERTIMRTNPRRHRKRSVPRAAEYDDPQTHAYGLKVSICWDT